MAEISVKLLANAITCNTVANTVYGNGLIRVCNFDTSAHLISVAFANALVYASTTVRPGETLYIQKNYTDLLSSNATTAVMDATPVKRGTI